MSVPVATVRRMSRQDWERRLPEGVHLESRDRSGFRLGVAMPVGEDGLWPMRCPEHPQDHFFKIEVTQKADSDGDAEDAQLYCAYCGHAADLWDFAPEQHARVMAAATAAAEQWMASEIDAMIGKAFGGRSRSSSRTSGISIELKPGRPPARRSLPEVGDVEETRRTMQCRACEEVVAVYGLAIYCPNCGQLAPAQQFAQLIGMHRDGLAALDALPEDLKRSLAESGVLGANYENTIKDGFGALETYLKARFHAEAPGVSLQGQGNIFQRLDDVADLYRKHLTVDLPGLLDVAGWQHLQQVAAMRHVLVHNAGIVDAKFLDRLPSWPQQQGQRIQIKRADAVDFVKLLERLAAVLS
jgi:hypothetical protein